jgi:outer membrane protein TolC
MKQKKIFLVVALLVSQSANAMTWAEFYKQATQKSPEIQSLRLRYSVKNLPELVVDSQFDWTLTLEAGQKRDRTVSLTNRAFDLEESMLYTASVEKYFATGTKLDLEILSQRLESTTTFLAAPRDGVFNSYLLTLEQNLWRDSFGIGSRARLNAADAEGEIYNLTGLELIEEALIKGSRLYWSAAVAFRKLNESKAALKRYETLVKNIEQKARNRYAAPGELSQVKAGYFNQQRQTQLNQLAFDRALLDLKVFLPEMSSDKWVLPMDIPKYSQKIKSENMNIEDTRSFKISQLQKTQAAHNATSIKQQGRSQVALVGQVGATGVDTYTRPSQEQLINGDRPSWYIGVKWSQSFGSGIQSAQTKQAQAQAQAQEILFETESVRLKKLKDQLELDVFTLEDNLKVQLQVLNSRRDAVKELTQIFNQGRIDISILIAAIDRAEDAEVEQVQVRADLEIAYLQWLSLHDKIL